MKQNEHFVELQSTGLTANWAQRIVNQHVINAKVFAVKLQSMDVGTSTRWRIEVTHDSPDLPSRWFVKTPSLAFKSRLITALPRFLHKEVSFYRALSEQVPVRLPRILAAESRFGRGSTLVLSDLAESAFKPGQTGEALTVEQAVQVVERLANLHGRFWNRSELLKHHRWLNGFSQQTESHMGSLLAVPLMKRGLQAAEDLIDSKLHAPAIHYAAHRRRIKRFLASGPQTLVHYDCHPGNLFWTDSEPGFLDWQLVRVGEGIGDVAYFLATSLQPETRRKHEQYLLKRYAEQLSQSGVKAVDEKKLFQRYCQHLVYPFEAMVVTLAIGGMMDLGSNVEMIKRAAAAVDDHDSFARIRT